eukprot:CAMPEP_0181186548 /NCGR_PEP_ID=MMETSP1096-20121128/10094_1 /TAXON_ID=156174 ORGANISM="Chrysochromulina ericina, Strain CCMP281" /NCGR_SAMPLE_ID=MMETSP1096 /ASSEMBLY_ACC=CAM_ASM_000453 /LENGTH=218 /DNA_ID=CAMNT_0023275455 /DNA_START=220 /DNA_END=875 /DNA_ORIENTATION=+
MTAFIVLDIAISAFTQGWRRFWLQWSNWFDVSVALLCVGVIFLHALGPLAELELEEEVETAILTCRYVAQIARLGVMVKNMKRQAQQIVDVHLDDDGMSDGSAAMDDPLPADVGHGSGDVALAAAPAPAEANSADPTDLPTHSGVARAKPPGGDRRRWCISCDEQGSARAAATCGTSIIEPSLDSCHMRGESSGLCGLCGMGRGATNAGAHIGAHRGA